MPRATAAKRSASLAAARAAAAAELLAVEKPYGRPKAVLLDKKTLDTIQGLAQIDCTDKEIAGVLGISQVTWIAMKRDHPELVDLVEDGRAKGNASIRRQQMAAAARGNSAILIWLGKQRLGQSDKHEFTGKNGGPIQTVDVSALSPAELLALDTALAQLDAPAGEGAEGEDSGGESASGGTGPGGFVDG